MSDFIIKNGLLERYTGGGGVVTIPEGVKCIGAWAFKKGSNLTNVIIPNSVTSINNFAFDGCRNLTSITIPSSVTRLDGAAFLGCDSLTEIKVDPNNEQFFAENDILYNKSKTKLILAGKGIGSIIVLNSVTEIGIHAFEGCKNLTSVTIPDSVTNIGREAFKGCSGLTEIILPPNVKNIESDVFYGCKALIKFEVPSKVKKIARGAFCGCENLASIELPTNIEEIGRSAFLFCGSLKEVRISSLEKWVKIAFEDKEANPLHKGAALYIKGKLISQLVFPKDIAVVNAYAFYGAKIKGIEIHEALSYGEDAFPRKALNKYDNALYIGAKENPYYILYAAEKKTITACEVHAQTQKISSKAFAGCKGLTKVVIPASVKEIEKDVFEKCPLVTIYAPIGSAAEKFSKKAKINFEPMAVVSMQVSVPAEQVEEEKPKEISERIKQQIAEFDSIVAREKSKLKQEFPELQALIKKDISFADGSGKCKPEDLVVYLSRYYQCYLDHSKDYRNDRYGTITRELSNPSAIKPIKEVDEIAECLNKEELLAILSSMVYGQKYRFVLIPFTILAEKAALNTFINAIDEGKRARSWIIQAYSLLMLLNDEFETAEYMHKTGKLGEYAKWRGMSLAYFRDTKFLPNLNVDEDGKRVFEFGELRLECSIGADLRVKLTDLNTNKELRSFPKKGASEGELAEYKEQYLAIKNDVEKFIADRRSILLEMYMQGGYVESELWEKVYRKHPVIKYMIQCIIWKDKKNQFFMISERGESVDVNGNAYTPTGKVYVAHILDMPENEVEAWRRRLVAQKQALMIPQVWEPIPVQDPRLLEKRYDGIVITSKERNTFKKRLQERGIESKSEAKDREFNHRSGRWEFSPESTMYIDGYNYRLEYRVEEDGTLKLGTFHVPYSPTNKRILNFIVSELDKMTLGYYVRQNEHEKITDELLEGKTVVQINELLEISIKHESAACTVRLIDWKTKRFGYASEVDEFVLPEW